jgi:hypothetical protein
MAESHDDGSIAPRRSLSGPILPPPPPELTPEARRADEERAAAARAEAERKAAREAARTQEARADKARAERERAERAQEKAQAKAVARAETKAQKSERPARAARQARTRPVQGPASRGGPRRTRRAQLRLVQIDAWSVMKTSFLLSIALGIVLVVAVAIIWSVLGAAGVWDSINSIVQQAVGNTSGKPFDIQEYAGTSRVLGFTMIVAVLDVILITAIATLGAFLYNLSAALLGGIEVTLAEDN